MILMVIEDLPEEHTSRSVSYRSALMVSWVLCSIVVYVPCHCMCILSRCVHSTWSSSVGCSFQLPPVNPLVPSHIVSRTVLPNTITKFKILRCRRHCYHRYCYHFHPMYGARGDVPQRSHDGWNSCHVPGPPPNSPSPYAPSPNPELS